MEREKWKSSRMAFPFEWASILYRRSSRRQTQYLRMSPTFVRRSYRMLDAWNCFMVLPDRTLGIDFEQRTPLYISCGRLFLYFFHDSFVPCIALDIWTAASLGFSKVNYGLKLQVEYIICDFGLRQRGHCIIHKIIGENFFFLGGGRWSC